MASLDLRPLSLGEILDRTFSVYRNNFVLFAGIAAVPQVLILALHLVQVWAGQMPGAVNRPVRASSAAIPVELFVLVVVGIIVYLIAYLFAQGGTVFAVSELYLGRTTTIADSLRKMRGHAGTLFGVSLLNGIACLAAAILLIIPGIWLACRLITCVPAALLEDLGPRDSLERSFALTKGSAGRSFVIYLLYLALAMIASIVLVTPFSFAAGFFMRSDPSAVRLWLAVAQVGTSIADVLVTPFFLIATAIFYYDLRVRKEAFDLQLMMNPSGTVAAPASGLPSMFS